MTEAKTQDPRIRSAGASLRVDKMPPLMELAQRVHSVRVRLMEQGGELIAAHDGAMNRMTGATPQPDNGERAMKGPEYAGYLGELQQAVAELEQAAEVTLTNLNSTVHRLTNIA